MQWASLVQTLTNRYPKAATMVLIDLLNEPDSQYLAWDWGWNTPGATELYLKGMDAIAAVNPCALPCCVYSAVRWYLGGAMPDAGLGRGECSSVGRRPGILGAVTARALVAWQKGEGCPACWMQSCTVHMISCSCRCAAAMLIRLHGQITPCTGIVQIFVPHPFYRGREPCSQPCCSHSI